MDKCCLAFIPPIFIGLSCTTASSEKINDIIKKKLPYSQKYINVVGTISKLLMGMIDKKMEFNI